MPPGFFRILSFYKIDIALPRSKNGRAESFCSKNTNFYHIYSRKVPTDKNHSFFGKSFNIFGLCIVLLAKAFTGIPKNYFCYRISQSFLFPKEVPV